MLPCEESSTARGSGRWCPSSSRSQSCLPPFRSWATCAIGTCIWSTLRPHAIVKSGARAVQQIVFIVPITWCYGREPATARVFRRRRRRGLVHCGRTGPPCDPAGTVQPDPVSGARVGRSTPGTTAEVGAFDASGTQCAASRPGEPCLRRSGPARGEDGLRGVVRGTACRHAVLHQRRHSALRHQRLAKGLPRRAGAPSRVPTHGGLAAAVDAGRADVAVGPIPPRWEGPAQEPVSKNSSSPPPPKPN